MSSNPLNIAVIGSGVAGLSAAYLLNQKHRVTLIEKSKRIGGHTRTLDLRLNSDTNLKIDTGFIVMNLRNYPLFNKLLEELNVSIQKSCMTFSYSDTIKNYSYAGTSFRGMFPHIKYLFDLNHFALIGDLVRFALIGHKDLKSGFLKRKTLGDYLDERRFCPVFQNRYLFPMGAAIWSSPVSKMRDFPAEPYLHFLDNHGLLRMLNAPQWFTIKGGSQTYVKAILKTFNNEPKCGAKIQKILRPENAPIEIYYSSGEIETYDHVIIATHADTALELLGDADTCEKKCLSPWRYQENHVFLHTDKTYLPPKKIHWASWNFLRKQSSDNFTNNSSPVCVSYYMNRLQNLKASETYIVTLNPQTEIDPKKIINKTVMTHPLYTFDSLNSQSQLKVNNGRRNTWYCGSYFGYGFHEDAVRSSFELVKRLDSTILTESPV